MMDQPRYNPQAPSPFFTDGRAQRPLVPGTVARGEQNADPAFYRGKNPAGVWVAHNPLPVTRELLLRGQQRYNIYCGPCHDRAGTGRGLIVDPKYAAFPPPPSFHDDRIRQMADGEIFNTVSNGIRTMPGYRHQIAEGDRWAIIAYMRALERSQDTPVRDLAADEAEKLEGKR